MISTAPVPTLPPHSLLVFLLQVGVLLLLALVLGRLATRIRLPSVVGELCAGVFMGPSLLNHVTPGLAGWLLPKDAAQFHLLDAVGQVGVLLLIGMTGVEMDLRLIRRKRRVALSVGFAGLVLPFGSGVAVGWLLPASLVPAGENRAVVALFLGVALCVSAIPVIAKTLTDMKLAHRDIGQLTLAVGVIDDVVGWLLLSVVSAMAVGQVSAGTVAQSLGHTALLVLVAVTIGRPLVRWVMSWANGCAETGPPIAAATLIVLLSAAAAQALGMEAVFGALVGGALIGSVGAAGLSRLAPLRSVVLAVFAPLFFATAGLRIDLTALRHPTVFVTAVVVILVAILGKFVGAFLGALVGRMSRWEALALGAGMNARGVIEVVIATVGLRLGVLTTDTYTIVILVAIVTSVMAPPILGFAMRHVEQTAEEELRQQDQAVFTTGGVPGA